MQVLVVNGYGSHKSLFQFSFNLIKECFYNADIPDNNYIVRDPSQLHDVIVDWEYDQLDGKYEEMCLIFDKIDLIIILGEMEVLPWDLNSNQLIVLIKMAKQTKKPLIGLGFGAFSIIYSLSTKGRRLNFLNGPFGDNISKLSKFPSYGPNSGVLISVWYDQDTGDVYTYDPLNSHWKPICNIGITFIPSSGILAKKKNFTTQYSSTVPGKNEDIKEMDEDIVYISKGYLSHEYFNNVSHSNKFSLRLFTNWILNKAEYLPHDESLEVLAYSVEGIPVIFKCDNMLFLSCKLSQNPNSKFLNIILTNYINSIKNYSYNSSNGKIFLSLHSFLFGNSSNILQPDMKFCDGPFYDTSQHRKPMISPLAINPIPSSLSNGPKEISAPLLKLFNKPIKNSFQFIKKMPEKSILKNFTKKEKIIIQNPQNNLNRIKRIENAFEKIKINSNSKDLKPEEKDSLNLSSLLNNGNSNIDTIESNTSNNQTGVTNLLTNILNSVTMNDTSVTVRRHHVQHNSNLFMEIEFVNDLVKKKKNAIESSNIILEDDNKSNNSDEIIEQNSDEFIYNYSEYIEKDILVGINEENNLGQSDNNLIYKKLLEIPAEFFLLNKENSKSFNIIEFLKQAKGEKCIDLAVKCLINNEFSPESDTVVNFLNTLELEQVEEQDKINVFEFIDYMKRNCGQFLAAQVTINTYRNRYYKIKLDKLTNSTRKYIKFDNSANEETSQVETVSTPTKPIVPKIALPDIGSPKPLKEYTFENWDKKSQITRPLSASNIIPHPPQSPSPSYSGSQSARSTIKKSQPISKTNILVSPRKSQDILKNCSQSFQPLNHPKSLSKSFEDFDDHDELKKITVLVKDDCITRPISNYNKLRVSNEIIDEENKNNYQGSYITPYMTPYERDLQRFRQNKNDDATKNLPSFLTYFSTENSSLQIRKGGQIRADGPYQPISKISSREEQIEKWIAGPWKMT